MYTFYSVQSTGCTVYSVYTVYTVYTVQGTGISYCVISNKLNTTTNNENTAVYTLVGLILMLHLSL